MKNSKTIITVLVIVILALIGWAVLTMPDNRSTGTKVGNAVDSLNNGEGIEKSARQLEDRTPGERLGDAVKDAGDDIKKNTDNR